MPPLDPKWIADLDRREPKTSALALKLLRQAADLERQAAGLLRLEADLRRAALVAGADRIAQHAEKLTWHVANLRAKANAL